MTQPTPVSIAIVYAMTDEVRPLLKEAKISTKIIAKPALLQFGDFRGVRVVFCRTGIGIANAHEATERLFENAKPDLVLSIGCGGATHPDLKAGDLVLTTDIRSETPSDRFPTSEKARADLERLLREEALPYRTGSLMTVWKMAGKAAKEEIGAKGAACVEMETAAVAAIAEKAGVPIVSLRVIFDAIDEEFPSSEPFDEEHPVAYLIRNPKLILKIPRYAKIGALCRNRLHQAAGRFIAGRVKPMRACTEIIP